jgi:hypothetical protein
MFDAIKRRLFPPSRPSADTSRLEPVDTERVAEKLDVYENGAADGRSEIPDTSAKTLTASEVRIVGFFQDEAQAAVGFFHEKILDLQKFLKQKSLMRYDNRLSSIVPSFKAEIASTISINKPALEALKRAEKDRYDEYMSFRRRNHLSRSADYPENKFFLIAILVGILLIEAILKGYFFA